MGIGAAFRSLQYGEDFLYCVVEADEKGAGNDVVADIDFAQVGDARYRHEVAHSKTMAGMAVMMSRRFNTRINIHTDELKRYRFTGKIMNETLEQVLDILRMTTPLKYSVGKGYVDWEIDPGLKEQYDLLLNKI